MESSAVTEVRVGVTLADSDDAADAADAADASAPLEGVMRRGGFEDELATTTKHRKH